jgi:hypothetical protein
MISGGIVLSASAAPTDLLGERVSSNSSGIVVPDVPLTQRAPGQILTEATPVGPPGTLGPNVPPTGVLAPDPAAPGAPLESMIPAGTDPNSSSPVTLDTAGIPVRALEGYRKAASLVDSADPGCHIDWALVAAIGRVESNHARFGGNQLDTAGVAQPGIIGMRLDGSNGTARITDTDQGRLDRDTVFDRAVGPMQFIPSTWRFAGVDANGDGVKDPENMADAAAATAVYLCSGPGDLRRPADLRSAILRYNNSDSYVRMVTSIAAAYRQGVSALPASDIAPRPSAAPASPSANRTAAKVADNASLGAKAAATAAATAAAKAVSKPAGSPPAPSSTKATAKPVTAGSGATTPPAKPAVTTTKPGTVPSGPSTSTTTTSTTTTVPPTSTTTTVPPTTTTTTTVPVPTSTTVPPTTTTTTSTTSTQACLPSPTISIVEPAGPTASPSLPAPCPTDPAAATP